MKSFKFNHCKLESITQLKFTCSKLTTIETLEKGLKYTTTCAFLLKIHVVN